MHAGLVDTMQPSPEGMIEGVQFRDLGGGDFRVKRLLDQMPELLDFALALWMIGRGKDDLGAQRGAGGPELSGIEDLTVVNVEGVRYTAAQNGHLEHAFQARQGFVEEELPIGYQARMIVDEGDQVRAAGLSRARGVRQPRALAGIALPQRIHMVTFKAFRGDGLGPHALAGFAGLPQMRVQRMRVHGLPCAL